MIRASLLAIFLSACSAHGESYTLYISPEFTDDYAQHIEEAANDWERMVPAHFDIRRDACHDRQRTTTCAFPVGASYFDGQHGPKGAVGYTSCSGDVDDSCTVWLYVDMVVDSQRQLAGHELGHAMGLQHEGPGTAHPTTGPVIMAPSMPDAAPRPTCLDAAAWYALRGWVVPACPKLPGSDFSLD